MTTAVASDVMVRNREHTAAPAVAVATFASLGAGAIHAAAIGVHSEHRQAVIAFTIVAVAQLGWGVVALLNSGRLLAWAGAAINATVFAGWVLAKTSGISFVDGLEESEKIQLADGTAAALALVAVLAAIGTATLWRRAQPSWGTTQLGAVALIAAMVTVPSMISAGSHSHAGGHDEAAGASGDGHSHATPAVADGDDDSDAAASTDTTHGHEAAAVPPKKYEPTQPIDLGGVEGVSPEQQARAENLIAITLLRLPKFADPATAEAAGFSSIGDAVTGDEHYINPAYFDDGEILNPDRPESLVYQPDGNGGKKLVAAMYMMPPDTALEDVPDVGGKLTQWHIHNNLCFTPDGKVAGLTNGDGSCRAGLNKGNEAPMIHVWITPHPCGPFAALEGVGAGQIKPGEERLCDTAHGH